MYKIWTKIPNHLVKKSKNVMGDFLTHTVYNLCLSFISDLCALIALLIYYAHKTYVACLLDL